ncbi:hypothetical protein ACMFMG_000455 [Clarireedia jacksonii]
MREKYYIDYVATQIQRIPSLENLFAFLQKDLVEQPCKITCLEFGAQNEHPLRYDLDSDGLSNLLADSGGTYNVCGTTDKLSGRIIVVEDLTRAVIEILGKALDINPVFFSAHIDAPRVSLDSSRRSMLRLPSQARSQNFFNLRHHQVLRFGEGAGGWRGLVSSGNVPRKVVILPQTRDIHLGLVQRCCSVLFSSTKSKQWTGLVLVDPPVDGTYRSSKKAVNFPSALFQGGYEDFIESESFFEKTSDIPGRLSHFEDLIFYWTKKSPSSFELGSPNLLSVGYYPLKIVAAEWVKYIECLDRNVMLYEYSTTNPVQNQGFTKLDLDLRSMQTWTRRCLQTLTKLNYITMLIDSRALPDGEKEEYNLLLQDYKHLAAMVEKYSALLETKLAVVTSLVQITDSRWSLREAHNITRLTNLALLFVPLSFITSLLGMNDTISRHSLILFFSIAVPVCGIVFLIAWYPEMKIHLNRLAKKIGGLKRYFR